MWPLKKENLFFSFCKTPRVSPWHCKEEWVSTTGKKVEAKSLVERAWKDTCARYSRAPVNKTTEQTGRVKRRSVAVNFVSTDSMTSSQQLSAADKRLFALHGVRGHMLLMAEWEVAACRYVQLERLWVGTQATFVTQKRKIRPCGVF